MTIITTEVGKKYRSIIDEISQSLFERRDELELVALGDLSGENVYFLGEPGTAKTELALETSKRIVGANFKSVLLHPQLGEESLFGPIDIKAYKATGDWHRRTDGYLPWAHKIVLNEVGKAGAAVLNPLLDLLNEGTYDNNSVPMQCNIISAIGTSNEELEMPDLAAMWDRWLIRKVVEPIRDPGNFAAMLAGAVPTQSKATPTTITLDELQQARAEVPHVKLPPGIIDTIRELRSELRAEQIKPSDRRWRHAMRVLQASAYLYGRDTVDDDDLAVLQHILWDVVEQTDVVRKAVLSRTSPLTSAALKLSGMIQEIDANLTKRKGQASTARATYGGEAQSKVAEITKQLTDLIEQANRQGRNTARLDEVRDQLKAVKARIFIECLNVPADQANRLVNA